MNMNLRTAAVSSLALAAVSIPAVGVAQKPEQKLSIEAKPTAVNFGENVAITGQLTGGTAREISGQNVTLHRDAFPYDGGWQKVATNDTNDAGGYNFTDQPIANSKYRVSGKRGVQSAEVTVAVRAVVKSAVSDTTPKKGSRVTFGGTVAPPHDGRKARIQRKTSSGWKTVTKVTLADDGDIVSKFSKGVRIRRSGKYRVRFNPGDGDHAAGNSKAVRITTQ